MYRRNTQYKKIAGSVGYSARNRQHFKAQRWSSPFIVCIALFFRQLKNIQQKINIKKSANLVAQTINPTP